MTVATSGKKTSKCTWYPSVAVAGSVLLKQRNPHMNACAIIIGILLKARSLEVRIWTLKSLKNYMCTHGCCKTKKNTRDEIDNY